MKKNKPISLGQSISKISKTVLYEFWYGHINTKYQDQANLSYMDTGSFVINIKDVCKGIGNGVKQDFGGWRDKKKLKKQKKCIVKQKDLSLKTIKTCLQNNEIVLRLQQRFKKEAHSVFTKRVIKIALSFNDE